jgi:hypothetical protein
MSSQPAMLVAFLSGNAVVAGDERMPWWRDAGVQRRLCLTPAQVAQLDEIQQHASGADRTQMLWRMYQTLELEQRQIFSGMLEMIRTRTSSTV